METKTAICPVGNHEFTYEYAGGQPRTYCSDKHAWTGAARRVRNKRLEDPAPRQCSRCKQTKEPGEFAGPTAPYCKPCMAAWARERRAKNPDPNRSRREGLAKYKLTFEQFDAMLAAQGGVCAICRTDNPGGVGRYGTRGWVVEHDGSCCPTSKRSCGKCIRGITCQNCNLMLGNARDSVENLQAGIDYLLAYQSRRTDGHTSSTSEEDAATFRP